MITWPSRAFGTWEGFEIYQMADVVSDNIGTERASVKNDNVIPDNVALRML